jgi:hypothetical protein
MERILESVPEQKPAERSASPPVITDRDLGDEDAPDEDTTNIDRGYN